MNIYGIAWTASFDTAKIYADRRTSAKGQGVILKIEATPSMIVAALGELSDHARHLHKG